MNQFTIEQYKDLGYLPEAMFNFIALLGWSPQGEHEIFSREVPSKSSTKTSGKSPCCSFDPKKLEWINNTYVKKTPLEEVGWNEDLTIERESYRKKFLLKNMHGYEISMLHHDQMSYMKLVRFYQHYSSERFRSGKRQRKVSASRRNCSNSIECFMSELEAMETFWWAEYFGSY